MKKLIVLCTVVIASLIACNDDDNNKRNDEGSATDQFKLENLDIANAKAVYSINKENEKGRSELPTFKQSQIFKINYDGTEKEVIAKDVNGNPIPVSHVRFFDANSTHLAFNFVLSTDGKSYEYYINKSTGALTEIPEIFYYQYDYIYYIPPYDKDDNIYITKFKTPGFHELYKLKINKDNTLSYSKISGEYNVNRFWVDWNGYVYFDCNDSDELICCTPEGEHINIRQHVNNAYFFTTKNDNSGGLYYPTEDGLRWGSIINGEFRSELTDVANPGESINWRFLFDKNKTIYIGDKKIVVVKNRNDIKSYDSNIYSITSYDVLMSSDYIYWFNGNDNSIHRLNLDNGNEVEIFKGEGYTFYEYPGALYTKIFVTENDVVYFKALKPNGEKIHAKIENGTITENPDTGDYMASFVYN